jgi:uncharacterized protein YjbJ (UPF0337 family)
MGEETDKISGRVKQAVGAITGDEETKYEGSAKRTRASSRASSTRPSATRSTRLRT